MASNRGELSRVHHYFSDDERDEDVIVIVRPHLVRLKPGVFWFDEDVVENSLRDAIKSYFPAFSPTWDEVPIDTIKQWWKNFKGKYGYYKKDEARVKFVWELKARDCFENLMQPARYKVPSWFEDPVKEQFAAYKIREANLKKSAQAEANQFYEGAAMAAQSSGAQPTTPGLRMSSKHSKKEGGRVSKKTPRMCSKHSKKEGGWVSKTAAKVAEVFQSKKAKLSNTAEIKLLKLRMDAMEERERLRDEQVKRWQKEAAKWKKQKGLLLRLAGMEERERLRDERDKKREKEEAERKRQMDLVLTTLQESHAEMRLRLAALEERERLRDERDKKRDKEAAERTFVF